MKIYFLGGYFRNAKFTKNGKTKKLGKFILDKIKPKKILVLNWTSNNPKKNEYYMNKFKRYFKKFNVKEVFFASENSLKKIKEFMKKSSSEVSV